MNLSALLAMFSILGISYLTLIKSFGDASETPNPCARQRPPVEDLLGVVPDGITSDLDH